MRFIPLCCFPLVVLGSAFLHAQAEPFNCVRTIATPLPETGEALFLWLKHSGFTLLQVEPEPYSSDRLQVEIEKGPLQWSVRLSSHSALATRLEVLGPGGPECRQWEGLFDYLNDHRREDFQPVLPAVPAVPEAVRALCPAVVCIFSEPNSLPVQSSGFAIDAAGLIASTAHDRELGQVLVVRLKDQRQIQGRVIRLDSRRDLSLIKVPETLPTVVSLRRGRFMPAAGESLFTCGCPQAAIEIGGMQAGLPDGGFQAGILDGPPKRVSGQPLWQVRMHIDPGSSGSPVFDANGRLAAVVKGRYRGASGTGFLIPLETLLEFMGK